MPATVRLAPEQEAALRTLRAHARHIAADDARAAWEQGLDFQMPWPCTRICRDTVDAANPSALRLHKPDEGVPAKTGTSGA